MSAQFQFLVTVTPCQDWLEKQTQGEAKSPLGAAVLRASQIIHNKLCDSLLYVDCVEKQSVEVYQVVNLHQHDEEPTDPKKSKVTKKDGHASSTGEPT